MSSPVKVIDDIPVIDAKRPITLHITPADCKNGDPKDPSTCAAARAIMREHGAIACRVHLGRVYIRANKGNWQRYQTPKPLRQEIITFDRGGTFEPGEYTLSPMRASQRSGHPSRSKHVKAKKKVPQRAGHPIKRHIVANVRNGPA